MIREQWTASYRAKLARADEHLSTLYRETDGWGDGEPFRIVRGSNADGSVHEFGLRFETQPDVWRWGLLIGDALHNMRCALDHIVYALAVQQTGQDPPPNASRLNFPIRSRPEFWDRKTDKIVACLNEPTRAAIKRLQPYNRIKPGEWFAPLWWLAQLNDIDKHRLPHLTVVAAHPDEIATDAEPGSFKALWNEGPLFDGATLLRLELANPNTHVYVNLRATGAVVFRFKNMKPFGVHPLMMQIRREVGVVCRYLSRFGNN
jgi:hypothetical protein